MIGEKYYCGLDIGSQRIKSSLTKFKKGHFELVGVNESFTRGLKGAAVNDLGELSGCIHYCLKGLAKKTSFKVKDVCLGIGGHLIESRYSSAMMPLMDKGNKVIAAKDVRKINSQTCLLGINIEEEIIHEFSQNYIVDDNNSVSNPIGLFGRKLGANFLLVISKTNLVGNIVKAVNQAGYEAVKVAFSSLVAIETSLSKQNKEKGCILIDVGSSTTDLLFIKNGFLRELYILEIGGDHITDSLSKNLNLPLGLAEEIKKSYAVASQHEQSNTDEILVKRESQYVPIKRSDIYQAIEPEVAKHVNYIESTIKCSKMYDQIESGVVMIGGGSLLPGFIERIGTETGLPVRMGQVNLAYNRLNSPAVFAPAVGLAQCSHVKSFDHVLAVGQHTTRIKKLMANIKEWYQEYF